MATDSKFYEPTIVLLLNFYMAINNVSLEEERLS